MIRKNWLRKLSVLTFSLMLIGCTPSDPPASGTGSGPSTGSTDNITKDAGQAEKANVNNSPEKANKPLDQKYTETIPETLVEFDMILVAGNEESGIKPYYMGKTEVTWDEFDYWALCSDIKEKKAILEREKKLRPSPPHNVEAIYRNWGREGQPVVGVSRLSAQRYCDWLSEQTGKKYRLPTSSEWDHAYQAGGGVLDQSSDPEQLKTIAWFEGNSLDTEVTFTNRAMAVGKLAPNTLGLHDMLGNAAEWVTDTGDENIARGGSFITPADQLTGDHKDVEDQAVWNKNYPQGNKSLWWYVDADYVGFRVVCEPQ